MEFPIAFSHIPSWIHKENGVPPNKEAWGVYYAVTKWNYYLQGAEVIECNDCKPLARFINGKNANNKVNTWGLELTTYNITFKWILGAQNKAADCLSKLVELPHNRQATVQMFSATNHDGPTFHTRSRTAQHKITEDLTTKPKTDTVTLDCEVTTWLVVIDWMPTSNDGIL